jgi:serine/threonine-protein kinase
MLQAFIDRRFYGIQVDYRDSALRAQAAWRPNRPVGSIGPRIGAYDIIEPLGRGGMAEVYRGRHISLDRDVAIKVLPRTLAEQEDFRTRFEREAQAVASLQHPNIVQVYDFGEADGAYYMVMEIIKGPDLGAYLSQHGKLPLAEAQLLVDGIASALDYAHAQGLVHRDVKPSNIMLKPVTVTGSGASSVQQQPVLTDFGIVKIRGAGTRLTNTGMVGTFDYIAPEQIRDSKDVDGRADIYSLGVLTYQLLTGRTPFSASNPAALLLAHLNQPPPDPRHVQPDVPAGTAQALLQALHKDPAARFAAAGDFARALC